MRKRFCILCLVLFLSGCSVVTQGEGKWEFCMSIQTKQISEQPAKVGLESKALDKIIDSITN